MSAHWESAVWGIVAGILIGALLALGHARADVLLIVNGAAIGPIGNKVVSDLWMQPRPYGCLTPDGYFHEGNSDGGGATFMPTKEFAGGKPSCPPTVFETNAEACERAMKEIGAQNYREPDSAYNQCLIIDYGKDGKGIKHGGASCYERYGETRLNGALVTCIPAPSGLKR